MVLTESAGSVLPRGRIVHFSSLVAENCIGPRPLTDILELDVGKPNLLTQDSVIKLAWLALSNKTRILS